ncbi:hypothetical protein [Shinella sp. HZN7]|uniref:hypothetical protein n=1 Tax=Shinella sp. (strain HZN7) TaxID=879274 RepID=UPI000ADFFBE9|nr:hypothetical protein [Shinella sp. HZN7]
MNGLPPLPPLGAFTWGGNGERMTPEQIASRRRMADAMISQGVDFSPVGSWTQGVVRVANAAAGNFAANRLEDEQRLAAGFPVRPGGLFGLLRPAPEQNPIKGLY